MPSMLILLEIAIYVALKRIILIVPFIAMPLKITLNMITMFGIMYIL